MNAAACSHSMKTSRAASLRLIEMMFVRLSGISKGDPDCEVCEMKELAAGP